MFDFSMDVRTLAEVLQHFESAGDKFVTVARENKRLKKDLDALNDDGFWDELEEMKVNSRDSMGLLGEAQVRETHGIFICTEIYQFEKSINFGGGGLREVLEEGPER